MDVLWNRKVIGRTEPVEVPYKRALVLFGRNVKKFGKPEMVEIDVVQYSFPKHKTKFLGGEQCSASEKVAFTRTELERGKPLGLPPSVKWTPFDKKESEDSPTTSS